MECTIPAANLKVISKAIQALSRMGNEICFHAKPDRLVLIGINMSKTAFVTFDFLDVFFSSYNVKATETGNCTCKMSMKTIASIFRGNNKEKRVETCKIIYESGDANITINMKFKRDVTMTHIVKLIECNHPNVSIPQDDSMNQICAASSFFNQILLMFQHNDEDISWDVTKDKAVARNFNADMQGCLKTIRTQIALNSVEFTTYTVKENTEITFSLRPFRAATQFAETHHLPITIKFTKPGRPVVLVVKSAIFEGKFLLATLINETETQSSVSPSIGGAASHTVNEMEFDFAEEMSAHESPQAKKVKLVFGRCSERTFHPTMLDLGSELAGNSDSDASDF